MKSVLETTGYLSRAQLMQFYRRSPQDFVLDSNTLWYADALWDRRQFRKGRHQNHWSLRTETYYAWAPYLRNWTNETDTLRVRPDALIEVLGQDFPIALEVDTAKETAHQWHKKLALYFDAPQDWRLLVVADGKNLRLSRLTQWLEAGPRPWAIVPRGNLILPPPTTWTSPKSLVIVPSSPPTSRIEFWLDNVLIDPDLAQTLLFTNRVSYHGEEMRHLTHIYYLRSNTTFPIRRLGRFHTSS